MRTPSQPQSADTQNTRFVLDNTKYTFGLAHRAAAVTRQRARKTVPGANTHRWAHLCCRFFRLQDHVLFFGCFTIIVHLSECVPASVFGSAVFLVALPTLSRCGSGPIHTRPCFLPGFVCCTTGGRHTSKTIHAVRTGNKNNSGVTLTMSS